MLRKIRIALATVMMIGITWLFVDFTGTAHHWLSWMAKMQLLEAVLAVNVVVIVGLVLLTLVFGRIYCSVICPLGIMQDIIGWWSKKVKKNRYGYSKEKKWLRYPLLVVFGIAYALGLAVLVQLLAPYAAFGRIATNLLQPIYQAGNNVLAAIAEHYESYAFYQSEVWLRSGISLGIAAVTLIVLGILAWRNGRTYCNTICPVGTLLSLISRFSLLKVRFDADKCRNCSLCSKNCKAACIDFKTHTVDASRCVVCGDCIESCKFGALSYSMKPLLTEREQKPEMGRRSFLLSSALLATAAMAQQKDKIMDGGLAEIEDKIAPERQTPLTPPGSLSAQNMALRCTGCQLCISECPNQVLRPSSDLLHLMQPVMSYERGYCRPECNRCSEVCPAGAIKPIKAEDKASLQIGHAVWIKKNCIPLTDGVECGNCERHCPVGAIEMVPSDPDDEESPYVPAVNEARCIGCGACENLCPARPYSAIYVEGHEVHKEV
ncbi:4Fe-4S binding domain-containing protein [Prevotellaceae bacterium MN60]|nr:4Fe-4S binding domain-containing protein [Prevotellaceae bacterium MN60]